MCYDVHARRLTIKRLCILHLKVTWVDQLKRDLRLSNDLLFSLLHILITHFKHDVGLLGVQISELLTKHYYLQILFFFYFLKSSLLLLLLQLLITTFNFSLAGLFFFEFHFAVLLSKKSLLLNLKSLCHQFIYVGSFVFIYLRLSSDQFLLDFLIIRLFVLH